MYLQKEATPRLPSPASPHPQPPGVHGEAAGATLGLQYPGSSWLDPPWGLGISLLPPPQPLAFPSFLPSSLPQPHRDWLACGASREHPSLETREHLEADTLTAAARTTTPPPPPFSLHSPLPPTPTEILGPAGSRVKPIWGEGGRARGKRPAPAVPPGRSAAQSDSSHCVSCCGWLRTLREPGPYRFSQQAPRSPPAHLLQFSKISHPPCAALQRASLRGVFTQTGALPLPGGRQSRPAAPRVAVCARG